MTVKIGILGFAHGHVNMYCAKWREKPESEVKVVAGWDHDQGRLENARQNLGIEAFSTPEQLLQEGDVDAVVISAETVHHAKLAEKAAEAGKAIVMQKPMAISMEHAERIVQAVNKAGVPFTVAWQMRVDPQNLRMKQLVQEGTLGRILMIRRRHGLTTQFWPTFVDTWHVKPELNRGMWADDAAHPIDFLYWMMGEPVSVTADIDTILDPRIPDDQGIAIYRFPDGAFGEVFCSFTQVAGENTTEIVGEKGVAVQNYGDGPSCGVPRPENAVGLKWFVHGESDWIDSGIETPNSHAVRIGALAEPILEFLQGKRPAIATAEEGRMALKMTLTCYDSAAKGQRIRF